MGAEPGRGAGSSWACASPLTHHFLGRSSVVRHYKVKHEGPKYVIDVEEPVSVGLGYWKTRGGGSAPLPQQPRLRPLPASSSPATHSTQWSTIS